MNGVLIVDKPVGPTSHDIVICARRSLGVSRIGHTGTLDPQASGVLPLVLGQATRLAQHLSSSDKEYIATIRFGLVTDTLDASGIVLAQSDRIPSVAALEAALTGFRGTFSQAPPLFSAKMVDGTRSYDRARAGKPVQAEPVPVTTHILELLDLADDRAQLRVRCSAGFYVRSLADDLGTLLGTGAILQALVRTEAAGFTGAQAMSFEWLVTAPRSELHAAVQPLETLLTTLPAVSLTEQGEAWAQHGRDVGIDQCVQSGVTAAPLVRMFGREGRMLGLATPSAVPGFLHPAVIFNYN